MKQLFTFLIIFCVGAVSYAVLNPLLGSFLKKEPIKDVVTVSTSTQVAVPTKAPEPIAPVVEDTIEIDQAGGVHDGPFPLLTASGEKTSATVQIIRSPEETLLQFEGEPLKHSDDALIYFATDKVATKFYSIGSAKLTDTVFIYGMPIDVNMNIYKYILIYNPTTAKTEFYTEI